MAEILAAPPVTVGSLAEELDVPVGIVCQKISTLIFRMGRDEVIAQAAGMRTTILTPAGAEAVRRALGVDTERSRAELLALRKLHFAEAADLIDALEAVECGCGGCDSCIQHACALRLREAAGALA